MRIFLLLGFAFEALADLLSTGMSSASRASARGRPAAPSRSATSCIVAMAAMKMAVQLCNGLCCAGFDLKPCLAVLTLLALEGQGEG